MAYVISDACNKCGKCVPACPTDAIFEKETSFWIDPEKCVDCGTCEPECPVSAISPGE